MTSHGGETVAVEAIKAGALDYVVKSAVNLADMPRVAERVLREWGHIVERKRAEDALRHYSERLETLHEIDQAILAADSPQAIAQAALERIGSIISCPSSGIVAIDSETRETRVLATRTADQTLIGTEAHFPLAVLAHVDMYRQGETRVVDDIRSVSKLSHAEQVMSELGVRSYIGVPLIVHEELIGVLVLVAHEPRVCLPENAEVAQEVARSLAIAIQQARLREELQRRTQQVELSLREKEALLQEVHHRVKNNLQVISSLLSLQSERIKHRPTLDIFLDSQVRVQSMALVHEALYQSPELAQVDFGEYVRSLTGYLLRAYGISPGKVVLKTDVRDVTLGISVAVPCGLIINELVSNAVKHAFPEGNSGEITVGLYSDQTGFRLVVRDDGIGLPVDLDLQNPDSLGLQLVDTLVGQLEGTIELDRSHGTRFDISFAEPEQDQES
jgi:two-component sensor histidine kinase